MDEGTRQNEWEDAVLLFRFTQDKTAIVNLLRKLHNPHEIPDLWFLADLLEGKHTLGKGRPPKHRISAGLKEAIAANTVATLILEGNLVVGKLSVENAVADAAEILHMSESFIKKSYYKSLEHQKNSSKQIQD